MDAGKIYNGFNNWLRMAVKRAAMGEHLHSISEKGLLRHETNCHGDGIAFTNCSIFDGIRPNLQPDMTVFVVGEKIVEVGCKEKVAIPKNCFTVDASGMTLMPGLIDGHVHLCSPFTYDVNIAAVRQMRRQIALNHLQTVYSGVTTVCDMGGPRGIIKEFQELTNKNDLPGPRSLNCFTLISPIRGKTLGYPTQVKRIDPFQAWLLEGQVATRPNSIKEIKKVCYKIREDGGDHIKTTYQPYPFSAKQFSRPKDFPVFDDDWMRAILRIGRETGMTVSIHSPFGLCTEKCVDLAIETGAAIRIQHMTFDTVLKDQVIRKMRDAGFFIIPTVMVYGDAFDMPNFISWLEENPETVMTPEANRQIKKRIKDTIANEKYSGQEILELDSVYFRNHFNFVRRNTQAAHDAGIIGFGTDIGGTYTGFFGRICDEIAHYTKLGISAPDVLKYLTSVNAKIHGLKERGIVQSGGIADLILLDGNPLENPLALRNVRTVMKGGVFLKYDGVGLTSP